MPEAHGESHLDLLPVFETDGVRRVDAVIVPSGREAGHLRAAAELADELGSPLVALCSAASRAAGVAEHVAHRPDLRWHAVDVPDGHRHHLLPGRPHSPGRGGRAALSHKRNIGLLLARMLGWETVLFLDDDIRDLDADQIMLSAGGLGPASAVGMAVPGWPDNSVVCHANRLGGGDQSVFVGGSALLVDARADDLGHFPVVYNEDWLFLHDAMAAGRVRREGEVTQLPYDPFRDPRRGYLEEFGDTIAEGLVAHLEDGGRAVPLDPGFWADFLARRAAFVRRTAARVAAADPSPRCAAALRALAAAAARTAEIRPAHCVGFLREWRADRDTWLDRLDSAAAAADVPFALRSVGLEPQGIRRPAPAALATTVLRAPAGTGIAFVVPGFLDGRANPAHGALCSALRDAGLTAVTFDPRGTGASPGTPADSAPSTRLADLRSLLDRYTDASTTRVVLIGHSYGAWLCGLLAAIDPRVTDIVAIMPTRHFIWADAHDPARDDRWRRHGERIFSTPDPGSDHLRAVRVPHTVVTDAGGYDLPAGLADLRTPILFVSGENDTVVRPTVVVDLHSACGSRVKVHERLAGVGHDYRDDEHQRAAVQDVVLRWLARDREELMV